MAALIVNQGLQRIGINASAVGTLADAASFTTTRWIRTMAVDDGTVAFAAGHTNINSGGAVGNEFDQKLDAPGATQVGQVVSHVMTIGTPDAIFVIKRISLHDDTAANVSVSSTTLMGGVDGQSLTKTTAFTLAITLKITYTSA